MRMAIASPKRERVFDDVVEALGDVGLLGPGRSRCVDHVRVEVVGVTAELHDAALEAVTGPKRPVVEDQEDCLVDEQVVLDAAGTFELELERRVDDRVELFLVEVREGDEVSPLQQLGDHFFCLSFLGRGPHSLSFFDLVARTAGILVSV